MFVSRELLYEHTFVCSCELLKKGDIMDDELRIIIAIQAKLIVDIARISVALVKKKIRSKGVL